jgi:hypothetical protein
MARQYGAGAQGGATATAQLPQTGASEPAQNFTEASRRASRTGYQASPAFGGQVTQPTPSAPGYLTGHRVTIYASGGANTVGTVATGSSTGALQAFGAFAGNIFTSVEVRAANGPPIYSVSDPLAPYLIDVFSAQDAILQAADPVTWPSYSSISSGSIGTGNFLASFLIPYEITPGYGALAVGNAALQPQVRFSLNTASALYGTAPSTSPTLNVVVDEEYWAAVDGMEPAALGSTLQWSQVQGNPTVGSGSSMKVQLGKAAGWLTTLILIMRDSSGVASDFGWPGGASSGSAVPWANPAKVNNRIILYIDGIPVLDEDINTRMNKMYAQYPGLAVSASNHRVGPTGVIVYSFKPSISQVNLGQADTGETWIPVSPGSQVEIAGSPWGAFSGPGQITALMGCIVPSGAVRRGLGDLG